MKTGLHYFFAVIFFFFFLLETQATIRYVRPVSYGNQSGSSWANASNDLQLMINNSEAGDSVFVAEGTYYPNRRADILNIITPNDRKNSFVLKSDIQLFGGFSDNGTATWRDRNWNDYPSVLSGDIGKPNDSSDNCYHVVISAGEVGTACLNGFTVTKGNIFGEDDNNIAVNGHFISRSCGAGIHIISSSPILTNLIIRKNWAQEGGGISNSVNNHPLMLTNILIDSNEACMGGGIFNFANSSPLILTNVVIRKNNALIYGSGLGGGMANYHAFVILTNVLIVENCAHYGGGINNGEYSSIALTNVTISKNITKIYGWGGGGIHNNGTSVIVAVRNSIIWGNRYNSSYSDYSIEDNVKTTHEEMLPSYTHSLIGSSIEDTVPIGIGVIFDQDPLFMDTANGDYRLSCNSPAIDMGNNAYYHTDSTPNLSEITTDLDGNRRIYKGIVDLGAYELYADTFLFTPLSFIYDNTEQTPNVTSRSRRVPTLLYKAKNAPNDEYSSTPPINAGTYTVKAYLPASEWICHEAHDSADFVILSRELTIKAIDDTIYYGQTPALKYEIVSGSLANGDAISGALYVDNYEVGIHTIKQGTLTAGSNYILTFIEGTLLVWSIQDVFVDNTLSQRYKNYFQSNAECGKEEASVYVTCYQCVKILINGVEQNPCTVSLPRYGDNPISITVIAQNGDVHTHILTINKPIPFDQIVKMHCDNTITVNNNPLHNGGFNFTSFKWFCNDCKISEKQSWLVSSNSQWWSPWDLFYLELTADGYSGILRTCKSTISLKDMELNFYPNPVLVWQTLYIKGDLDDDCLKDAVIEIYDMRGRMIDTFPLTSLQIPISDRYNPAVYLFILKGKDGFRREVEIFVQM